MFIASVRPSVCPSVCLKPKFGRLKPKFDDDAEGGSAKRKLSSAPRSTSSILCTAFYINVREDMPEHGVKLDVH